MVDDANIKYEEVESSNLHSVGYDPETLNLYIIFKNGKTGKPNSKYVLYHVPSQTYAELMAAPSKGKYYAQYIRNVFSYDQIQL